MSLVASYFSNWLRASAAIDAAAIDRAVEVLADVRRRDASVWTVGNGGGSALASHLAIGLTLNTRRAGGEPFRAACLGADAAMLSAATNDFGSDDAFRTILECNGRTGDALCAISVSGESSNVNRAILAAKDMGIQVIGLVGAAESTTVQLADHTILLGSIEPGIAEDVASAVIHAMYYTFMYENHENVPSELADVL